MKTVHIASALGFILMGFGVILLTPLLFIFIDQDLNSILPFCVASSTSIFLGLYSWYKSGWNHDFDKVSRREGLLIVTLTWVVAALMGGIPYLFYGLNPLDACFESASGITTTGATILKDFSLYPKAFFFWRSLTQWLGGMGIIVLFVAILPQFSVAGRQMFFAEAPGPTEEKITPRIAHTAKALWVIYLSLTLIEIVLLYAFGMPFFDAICNSLTTMSAGGFSPHSQSILGYENNAAVWIVTAFMFLAGSNFALQYRMLAKKRPAALFKSEEFCLYYRIILLISALLCLSLVYSQREPLMLSIRDSLFQVISIITTAGFSSADFALWAISAKILLLAVMLVGGCAGSAGGGIKVVRILFMGKYLKQELVHILHPKAILRLKLDKNTVPDPIQGQMIGFILFYITLMLFSSFLVTIIEGDASIGFVGTAATIGNIGPGFGEIGPMGTFGNLAAGTKVIFIINMIAGRLELIPFLVMLHPDFWK